MRRHLLLTSAALAVFLALCVAVWMHFLRRGVLVVVHNSGAHAMFDIEAALGGELVRLGDIAAGGSAAGRVIPDADSDVMITFSDDARKRHLVQLDVYITGGLRGRVDAEIKDGKLENLSDNIDVALY